jgi:hypothetical protein
MTCSSKLTESSFSFLGSSIRALYEVLEEPGVKVCKEIVTPVMAQESAFFRKSLRPVETACH